MKKRLAGRLFIAALSVLSLLTLATCPAYCDPGDQLREPLSPPVPSPSAPASQDSDILLVMPAGGADDDDIKDVLKEVHGTVVGTIGEGPLTVLKVKVEKGKLLETEQKLTKDKNFCSVQRNFKFKVKAAGAAPVNDPYFANEWHLGAVNVVKAWQVNQGSGNVIGVLDTGCSLSNQDLAGKTYAGYDAITRRDGQRDVMGHGTMVATTAAARTNNRFATAAPAMNSYIYPVRIGTADGEVSEEAILQAIFRCGQMGVKIINISANADPPFSFSNRSVHPTLHNYLRWFHDSKGGLVFASAGNDGSFDRSPAVPYLIVVSAIGTNYSLAKFSTYGNPVWFTAPGVSIFCSDPNGRVVSVSGSSFSAPIAAAVAALVWGANPGLRNTDVERILINTCYKAGTAYRTSWYGYGMPNAERAIKMATGR